MIMARLYSNENFPFPVVAELRRLGHDVLTVSEAGKAEQAIQDDEVLAFAIEQERAVITINRKHFVALHRTKPDHAGIVVCTFDSEFTAQAERIDIALREYSNIKGELIRINRPLQ